MTDFTVLPPGTVVYPPDGKMFVMEFPDEDSAIVFYEFVRGFVAGEFGLEATDPNVQS